MKDLPGLDAEDVRRGRVCPYCGGAPSFVDSSVVYGRSYGMIFLCAPCDAYVGVHKGTRNALGRLADRDNRFWKKAAHRAFDELWKGGSMSRREAYAWLSERLGTPPEHTHIGMFDAGMCRRVCTEADRMVKTAKTLRRTATVA